MEIFTDLKEVYVKKINGFRETKAFCLPNYIIVIIYNHLILSHALFQRNIVGM